MCKLDRLFEIASANAHVAVALVGQLLGPFGHKAFDKLTKTRAVCNSHISIWPHSDEILQVSTLLSKLDANGVAQYTQFLMDSFVLNDTQSNDDDGKRIEASRAWACDELLHLSRNQHIPRDDGMQMNFFFLN